MRSAHKICKDCRYYSFPPEIGMAICKHPSAVEVDLVSGKEEHKSCQRQRGAGDCGPPGRHWEAKE